MLAPIVILAFGHAGAAPVGAAIEPATASPALAAGAGPSQPKRAVPDYDGRPEAEPSGWVWLPRIVLSPLYLVSEFVIRRPLGLLMRTTEKEVLGTKPIDDERGVTPTGRVDLGFRPSLGLYAFYDSIFADRDELRIHATTWGPKWFSVAALERVYVAESQWVGLRVELTHRDDFVFHGLGPGSRDADLGRYAATFVEGRLEHQTRTPDRLIELETSVLVRRASFDADEACCGDATVAERGAQGRYELPPSIGDGYAAVASRLDLALDTRGERAPENLEPASDFVAPPATGVFARAGGELAASLDARPVVAAGPERRLEWLRYGASAGVSLDLTGDQRVVGLSLAAEFARSLSGGDVPFTEQPSLGGERLNGFLPGRLVDRSLVVGRLDYSWPVWLALDGVISAEAGNVFPAELDGFSVDRLRSSFGVGVRSIGRPDHAFEILFAVGTEPFGEGAEPENVRFVLGWARGF
jgi:hypothetical protein